jgi:preprotein translocase subunit SecE
VAQQENAPNKPVHLIYLVGTVVLFFLLQWSIDWVWGDITTPPSDFTMSLIAGVSATVIGISAYRNDRLYHLANEVSTELKKVTWPTAKEVRSATLVVIVMALVSAVILFLFDLGWSYLTDKLYG